MTSKYIFVLSSKPLLQCTSTESSTGISNQRESGHNLRCMNVDRRRNFLYDIDRQRGVLVDFGLAEVCLT